MPDNATTTTSKKKVSAPLIYALLIAVGVFIYMELPNPDQTTATAKKRVTKTTSITADANGITAADYKAHFPRYVGTGRNPYVPAVLSASQENSSGLGLLGGKNSGPGGGSWSLTGINVLNGTAIAVIESSSGDSAELHVGDQWRGLKVSSISSDAVTFKNELGQTTQLSFGENDASGQNSDGGVPSLNQIRPLPPITITTPVTPVANTTVSGNSTLSTFGATFRSRRSSTNNNAGSSNAAQNSSQGSSNGGPEDAPGGPGGALPPPPGPPPTE